MAILNLIFMAYIVVSNIFIYHLVINIRDEQTTDSMKTNQKRTRKHSSIIQSNYDNSFGGRKGYEKYQNSDGLYEPVKPSKGINLKREV